MYANKLVTLIGPVEMSSLTVTWSIQRRSAASAPRGELITGQKEREVLC